MLLHHLRSKSFRRVIRDKSALPFHMGCYLRIRDFLTRTIRVLIQSRRNQLVVATSELIYPAIPKKRHACVCRFWGRFREDDEKFNA